MRYARDERLGATLEALERDDEALLRSAPCVSEESDEQWFACGVRILERAQIAITTTFVRAVTRHGKRGSACASLLRTSEIGRLPSALLGVPSRAYK